MLPPDSRLPTIPDTLGSPTGHPPPIPVVPDPQPANPPPNQFVHEVFQDPLEEDDLIFADEPNDPPPMVIDEAFIEEAFNIMLQELHPPEEQDVEIVEELEIPTDEEMIHDELPISDDEMSDDERVFGPEPVVQEPILEPNLDETEQLNEAQIGNSIVTGITITWMGVDNLFETIQVNKYTSFSEFAEGLNIIISQQRGTEYHLEDPTILRPVANCHTIYVNSQGEQIVPSFHADAGSSSNEQDLQILTELEGSDVEREILSEIDKAFAAIDWPEFSSSLAGIYIEEH